MITRRLTVYTQQIGVGIDDDFEGLPLADLRIIALGVLLLDPCTHGVERLDVPRLRLGVYGVQLARGNNELFRPDRRAVGVALDDRIPRNALDGVVQCVGA